MYHVANVPCVLHKGSRPYKNANYLAREGLQLFPQETTSPFSERPANASWLLYSCPEEALPWPGAS